MTEHRSLFIYTWLFTLLALIAPTAWPVAARHMQAVVSPDQRRAIDPGETIARVQKAISNGDVQMLSQYTSSYTEVSILGATTMYSRAQTAYILKAFFRDHPPARFTFDHRLHMGEDWFVRGRYFDRGRQTPYRLEMTMRWNGRQLEIKSIRISRLR